MSLFRLAPGLGALALLGASAALGCSSPPRSEIGEDACANGVDDDGDRLTDCADPACRLFAWCTGSDAGRSDAGQDASLNDAGMFDAGDAGPMICAEPLDVVLVLDVSSSMAEDVARIREAVPAIWDAAERVSTSPRFSLVVFVDDALAVNDCEPFASREDLAGQLELWRTFCATNRSPASSLPNYDCVENSLDALGTAITSCPWREGASRVIVHLTDDTFAERPAVLSGPTGPGILVTATYVEVSDALVRTGIRLGAFAMSGMGASCGGPTISPDVGRGFHTPFGAEASLPERTSGAVWDLRTVRAGELDVAASVTELLARVQCD